jgi:hypothetical protein
MTLVYVFGVIALIGYYAYLVLLFRPDLRKMVFGFFRRIGAFVARRSRLHAASWTQNKRVG